MIQIMMVVIHFCNGEEMRQERVVQWPFPCLPREKEWIRGLEKFPDSEKMNWDDEFFGEIIEVDHVFYDDHLFYDKDEGLFLPHVVFHTESLMAHVNRVNK